MLTSITSFIAGAIMAIGGWLGITNDTPVEPVVQEAPQEEAFGGFSPVAGSTYRLKASIGTTDTSIILSSFTEPITGNPMTMATINSDIGYATIDPQSSNRKEFISFTGVTQNADGSATLTGVLRGLGFQSPYTASTTLRKAHPGQSLLILSDSPQLFGEYARRRANETITGQWTFSVFPITPSTTPASATTSGQVELATGGEAASSTIYGDLLTVPLALHTGISTSSAPSSGNVVVVTGDDGNIDSGFIPDEITGIKSFTGTTTGIGKITYFTSTTSTQTWTKSTGTKIVEVYAFGGGGGGGGGPIDTSSGYSAGGGGGGGGGYSHHIFTGNIPTSTVTVTIGAGGAGGAGKVSGSAGSGSNGTNGGTSSFGIYLLALGGVGGGANGAAGAGGGGLTTSGITGGAGTVDGNGANGVDSYIAPTGGGGGASGIDKDGGNGGAIGTYVQTIAAGIGGQSGSTPNGSNGNSISNIIQGGTGGGGGGDGYNNGTAINGGNGGNGGNYGGGGGGGGLANNTSFAGGAGGRGGDGAIIVIEY